MTTIGNRLPPTALITQRSISVDGKNGAPPGKAKEQIIEQNPTSSQAAQPEPLAALKEFLNSPRTFTHTKGESYLGKAITVTPEQRAEMAQAKANSEAVVAAASMRSKEAESSISTAGMENHSMYLPNISDLSLAGAKWSLGVANVMIKNKEDVGVTVNGRYGDQDISDLNTYTAALKDYISKQESGMAEAAGALTHTATPGNATPDAAPQQRTTATSMYRDMQDMM